MYTLPTIIGIVGSGQMGCGIAQVAAQKGLTVLLNDASAAAIDRGFTVLQKSLERLVKKGTVTPDDAAATVGRIHTSHGSLEALRGADFIIEAVAEEENIKKEVFRSLDKVTRVGTILASNTSSISITRIASVTTRPHRVVGMHFMHPAPLVPLVELAKGMHTSQQTFETAQSLAQHLGKSVCVSIDRPGFLVYRLLMPLINEAFFLLSEGVGTAEDIDRSMRLGTNMQSGPLRMADNIGLDTCLNIMRTLHTQFGDPKYRPCPLLAQYVDGGLLGVKNGRGVFQYDPLIHDVVHAAQPHVNLTHHMASPASSASSYSL
ncbi:hypothetical protein PLESTB_001008100 [Pleodorina starrii]|uniref:3-hydroxybutyryl-CoA dehydrogenase n=1 Tax=Pleodorina starrii TaxID=330485 RepID=A0A9W6BNZ1_9CHLO|nr:hypothetical protein PLESTM_001199500 [Pleodorina starrii]GLC55624.1 hypothetical protein PLESTB_001008100 [Pleodorina starrii]GLC65374.1 hypothetical protein PLESTF_000286400 [Pleodorina starrii]